MSESQSPCLISDMRACHASNTKDTVFIIGSGSTQFKEDRDAIFEILDGFGLKGYFALLSEEEKGLDAFCDKICSKIRKSRFCIVMLNDPVSPRHIEGTVNRSEPVRAPSANVYYEFGMAVALGKSVVPVVQSGFRLPFDVQHLDAITYDSIRDLKDKLKRSIRVALEKNTKEVIAVNSELVRLIYGPLYNEIDRFLNRRDKFATFSPSAYGGILTQYKYMLDAIGADLQKEITRFYFDMDEFNSYLSAAERIIREIVVAQISIFFNLPLKGSLLSISVQLETDSGSVIAPTLEQILIRNTTPELFLQAQRSHEIVRRITYRLRKQDYKEEEMNDENFRRFFKKCRRKVEENIKIRRLRVLERNLEFKGKTLKEKLRRFCL